MTNNFNLPEAPIQNDDGILTFSHENTEFVVDVNSEKSVVKSSIAFQESITNGAKKQKEKTIGFSMIQLCIAKFTVVMITML